MKNVILFLMAVSCVLVTAPVNAGTLLPNGDFEGDTFVGRGGNIMPVLWDNANNIIDGGWGNPTVDQDYATDGSNGYVISQCDGTNATPGGYSVVFQEPLMSLAELGIPAGTEITLSADIIDLVVGGGDVGSILKVEAYAADGTTKVGELETQIAGITGSWANYSMSYTLPATTETVKCVFGVSTGWGGANALPTESGFDNLAIDVVGGTPALFPVPSVGAGYSSAATTISWQNPDPINPADTVTAAAYLLESDVELTDPNVGPGDPGVQTLTVDAGQESATVSLADDKYYYWAVHITDPNSGGPITVPGFTWDFQTFDTPPVVDAGVDQYLVKTGSSPMVLTIDATVTDDGSNTITWTDLTDPADKDPGTTVTINSPATEDTTVDLTNADPDAVTGYYVFEISVDDGVNPAVTDTIDIVVYPTCREAAEGDPANTFYDANGAGDLDGSCKVDLADFALFAASWLDCDASRITCP